MSLFPNRLHEKPYENPVLPSDSVIAEDPYYNWAAFAPRPVTGKPQTGPIKFGQDHIRDNPLGQKYVGSLQSDRIHPTPFVIPAPTRAEPIEPVDTVKATEEKPVEVAPVKPEQKGTGRTTITEHIAPHDLPRPFAPAKLVF